MRLLDTSTCVALLRGKPSRVTERFLEADPSDLCLCSIVAAELLVGALRASDPVAETAKVETLLSGMAILDFGMPEAVAYAKVRTELEAAGSKIGANDLIIAATALAGRLTLVTHNSKEFGRIANLPLEDWEVEKFD